VNSPKLNPTTNDKGLPQPQKSINEQLFPTPDMGHFLIPPQVQHPQRSAEKDVLKPRKAAIIGTSPSSRMVAPYGDPSWTIWGTSPGNIGGVLPRIDAWFEIHSNFLWPEYRQYGEPYLRWLNEQTFPVMAQDQTLIPRAQQFPKKELIDKFGPFFFTSTFAWVMAYAIHVGVKEIGLYGVDMASRDEYILQRPGGHYFIQRAKEAGVKIHIPPESDLAQPPPLYGYSDSTTMGRKVATRELEIRQRIAGLEQQGMQINQQLAYMKGALEDIDYFRQIWSSAQEHGNYSF
jgi:hypothetical protein